MEIIFFLLMSSVSIFLISFFNKRFEDGIHLSFLFSMFILYSFAILNQLYLGVWFISICALLLYIVSIAKIFNIIKSGNYKQIVSNFFTEGFWVFLIFYILCLIVTKDRIPYQWDEFSHWCDTVKIMYMHNDLPTNPIYYAGYPHYPPGVSLLQYYFLKLNNNYDEWIIYFIQKIFALSLIVPFVKFNNNSIDNSNNSVKSSNILLNSLKILLISISSFVLITLFGIEFYTTAYIDTFLGIVFGFGFAYIFLFDINKALNFITIVLTIFSLCIIKEAGTTFAMALSLVLIIEIIRNKKNYEIPKIIALLCITIFSSVYPLSSWSKEMDNQNINIVSDREFNINMLFTLGQNENDDYRIETLNNFIEKIFSNDLEVSYFTTSHFIIFLITLILFILLGIYYLKIFNKNNFNNNFNKKIYIIILFYIIAIAYTIGLLISYMYFFMEYEAIRLASFDRYVFILYSAFTVFIISNIIYIFDISKINQLSCTSILFIFLLSFDYTYLQKSFAKEDIENAIIGREKLNYLIDNFKGVQDPDISENILLVIQNTTGFENKQIKYLMRPDNVTKAAFTFGIPYHENDIWTLQYDLNQWEEFIFDKFGYEYIMMVNVDLQFIELYKNSFSEPETIKNNSIFKINQEKRIIENIFSDDSIINIY